jgi:hypothetical protein
MHGTLHRDQRHTGITSGAFKLDRDRQEILAKMSDDPKTNVPLLTLSVDLLPHLQDRNLEIPSAALCKAPETILQLVEVS